MQDSEFYDCIEAIEERMDGLSGIILADHGAAPDSFNWFGYLCGYCRALNEFGEDGPNADYSIVYQTFNDEDHEDFHEGFVTALSCTLEAYNRVVDESDERFIPIEPEQ